MKHWSDPPSATTRRVSPFPAINDYTFLSDCETTALVAPSRNVEWLCLPRMDSPSVFGAILDRGAGGFRVGPADASVPAARRYLPGTMVLETSWGCASGWLIVRDVLLIGPWYLDERRSRTQRRAPTDYDAHHVLLRTLRCVNGEVQVGLDCEPVFDYGRCRAHWEYRDAGYHGRSQPRTVSTSSCACPPTCAWAHGHCRRVDGRRLGTSLPDGRRRRRAHRYRGLLHQLFVLVGVGLRRDRRVRSRPGAVRAVVGHASTLGLYAEELDPRTGRHLGNFPQAFTHLALVNALVQVIRADTPTYTFPEDGASL